VNLTLQRIIDRYVGVLLCRLLSLSPRRATALPKDPAAILVILLSEMGSLVLALPMFHSLRERYPHARLYALVFERNREMVDILGVMAPEDVFSLRDTAASTFIWDSLRVIRRLRRLPLAAVIDCELFARVSSLFARLSGAPLQVGFHPHTQEGLYRGGFINRPVPYNPYLHISHQYLNLAAALDSTTCPVGKRRAVDALPEVPRMTFPVQEIDAFIQRLLGDYPIFTGRRLVLVYPAGGLLPIRAWPPAYYAALCRDLIKDGFAIGIIGLKSDQAHAECLVAYCSDPQCVNLTGYTRSLRELLLLLQYAALLITNDGGPGQFAALTAVPSIVLFGPETPLLYGPLSPHAHCLFTRMSCAPCLTAYNHRNSPCDGDNRCLQEITPDQVLATARALLAADALSSNLTAV
jgi:ADP-heptose:LPS heptosyltransferase